MCGELSGTTKLFHTKLRLCNWHINFVRICSFDLWYCPKFIAFQYFLFPKIYSIWIKGQSEHSTLCPDTRAVLFGLGERLFSWSNFSLDYNVDDLLNGKLVRHFGYIVNRLDWSGYWVVLVHFEHVVQQTVVLRWNTHTHTHVIIRI